MKLRYTKIICLVSCLQISCLSLIGQTTPDRHSTVTEDAWLSCTPSSNPNALRGTSHWIKYDLGYSYPITTLDVWNFNHPDSLSHGIQRAVVDVSANGSTWTTLGEMTIPRGTGSSFYTGTKSLINFGLTPCRYVLITAISNYGGSCYGLSELKFNLNVAALPVSISNETALCNGKNIDITWKANSESNISEYLVESSDDAQTWSTVQSLSPRGSGWYSTQIPAIQNPYLRIRALGVDAKEYTSQIILSDCNNTESALVSLFPNPIDQKASLSFSSDLVPIVNQIKILDLLGREVWSAKTAPIIESVDLRFDQYTKGTYFVEVSTKSKKYVIKAVKL